MFVKQVSTRLDGIAYGILGAYGFYYHNKWWHLNRKKLLYIGLGLLLFQNNVLSYLSNGHDLYAAAFSFSIKAIGAMLLLPYLSSLKKGEGKLCKVITSLSVLSYALYLLNLSVVQLWILNKIPWAEITTSAYMVVLSRYVLFWFLSIILSIVMYKYFEQPILRIRERFLSN